MSFAAYNSEKTAKVLNLIGARLKYGLSCGLWKYVSFDAE